MSTDDDNDIAEFLVTVLQACDAYKQGHAAARADLHPADCPYEDHILEIAWRNGWCDGTLGIDVDTGLAAFRNMTEESEREAA